jgi:hypothetical protein
MAAAPKIQKGTGPDALPEGAATQINAIPQTMTPQAGAAQVQAGAEQAGTPPEAPEMGAPGGHELMASLAGKIPQAPVDFQPQTDAEKFLYEPGAPRNPSVVAGGSLTQGPILPPPNVGDWLPSLQMAASDPSASPQVKALFALVAHHITASQGQ